MGDCREAVDGLDFGGLGNVGAGDNQRGTLNENNVLVRRQRYQQQEWIKKVSTGVLVVAGTSVLFYCLVWPGLVRFWHWGIDSGFFGKCY